jgi:hypothetical protein
MMCLADGFQPVQATTTGNHCEGIFHLGCITHRTGPCRLKGMGLETTGTGVCRLKGMGLESAGTGPCRLKGMGLEN